MTKAQHRVLKFVTEWVDRNKGFGAMVGRGMEGTNRNDQAVAERLVEKGLLDWNTHEYTGELEYWPTDLGRVALENCSYCDKPSTTITCGVGGCPLGADL